MTDRTAAIDDVTTGAAIGDPIVIPDDEVNDVALRPDGLELASDGPVQTGMTIWDLDPDHWIEAACRLAGRNLTPDEWDKNLGALRSYRVTCPESPTAEMTPIARCGTRRRVRQPGR